MKVLAIVMLFLIPAANAARAVEPAAAFTLREAVDFALKNNPGLAASGRDVEIEAYGVERAKAERMPRVDVNSGVTRYRYPAPITPIAGSPLAGAGFPEFDNTISDAALSMIMPLYRGGRLDREVRIAEVKKLMAEDNFAAQRQDLIFNITSVVYKIAQMERLLEAREAAVRQLGVHRRNVEHFLQAGTVPAVELIRTEAELAHASHEALLTSNGIESAYGFLKALMGIEDQAKRVSVAIEDLQVPGRSPEECAVRALAQRPDYKVALRKEDLAEARIRLAEGRRLPSVLLSGEYSGRTGADVSLKENWNLALRLTLPVFDGGAVAAEVGRAKKERERAREEARGLRIGILREIRDARLNIDNAGQRMEVAEKSVDAARENLRIEMLRYETGAGTSADVIDAQTVLMRAEADLHQARFDRNIAIAALMKAIGEDAYTKEVSR